jgi:hypothetical protein
MNLGTLINFNLNTSNIFCEAWIYLRSYNSPSSRILWRDGTTGGQNFSFAVDSGSVISSNWGTVSGVNTALNNGGTAVVGLNTWTHVAWSYITTTGVPYVYLNGVPRAGTAIPGFINGYDPGLNTYIGRTSAPFLDGYIRDLRVVQGGVVPVANFTPGAAPFSYASPSYRANMGSTVFTLLGQFITYVPGKYNQAIRIMNNPVGGDSNVTSCRLTYTSTIPMTSAGGSLTCWIKFLGLPVGSDRCTPFFSHLSYVNIWGFNVLQTGGYGSQTYNSFTPVVGTWYHYSQVWNGSVMVVYINGAVLGTSAGGAISTPVNAYVNITAETVRPTSAEYDDLRIYNSALTAAQVQSVYSSQGAPAPSRAMPLPKLAWDFNGTTTEYMINRVISLRSGWTPTYGTGKYNRSLIFTNQAGVTPPVADFSCTFPWSVNISQGFTVAFWVKINVVNNTYIIHMGNTGTGWGININDGGSHYIDENGTYPYNSQNYNFVIGQWCHVLLSIGSAVSWYKNGAILGSPIPYVAGTASVLQNRFWVGSDEYYGFNGELDDLRIFDQALTSAQVQSIYNQQGVPGRAVQIATHLLSLIPSSPVFMQTFGTSSVPTSDLYGATLTSSGSPTMYLDATRGYVFPATGTTYMSSNFNLPVSYSKSIWVYLTGAPGTGNLLSSTNGGISGVHYLYFSGSYSLFAGHNSGTSVNNYVSDPGTITLNQWTHYVLTYDNPSTTMKLYKNGSLVAQATNAAMSWTGGNAVGICHYFGGNTLTNGRVDNPIIYNRALTVDDVSLLYTSQINNPTLGETTAGLTYNPIRLTGTPLFTQLSPSATSSAVGAFSLRAVNGTSARAVQVRPVAAFPPAAMTSNGPQTLPGYAFGGGGSYTASASSQLPGYGDATHAFRAFDSDPTNATTWHSEIVYDASGNYTGAVSTAGYSGEWLQIQMPSTTLYSYSMITRQYYDLRSPNIFYILGSNNGTDWILVDSQSGITGWTWPTRKTFIIASPVSTSFIYFRLVINKTNGPNSVQISSFILNGTLSGSSADFYADRLGNLLTAPVVGQTLANWLGGATGYVTTWYDQSGRGNHATQTTTANQPVIQRATKGPGYACLFSGSQRLALGSNAYVNNTPYTLQIVERRNVDSVTSGAGYFGWGGGEANPVSNVAHNGYRAYSLSYPDAQQQVWTNQYADDKVLTNVSIKFATAATENVAYTWHTHDLNHTARIYSWRGGTMYPSAFSTTVGTFANFLRPVGINQYFLGWSQVGYYQGEIYELLVFTQSLYDLDTSGGLITQVYQNQLGAYGT